MLLIVGTDTAVGKTWTGCALAQAAGQIEPRQALLRFRDPVAPPEAADREGRRIDFEALVALVRKHAARYDVALVEGAGGVLSPLTWERSAVDMGCALKVLELAQLDVVGIVLTAPEQPDASTGSNAAAISRLSGGRRILHVPRSSDPDIASQHLEEVTRWL